jgi:hypothetical protein
MTIVEFTTTPLMASCRLVLDRIDKLKNCGIDKSSLYKLKTSFQSLSNNANSNLLEDFPIDIAEEPIEDFWFEIGGPYHSVLKFTEMKNFVIDTLEQAQRNSDISLCLDALRVLINYGNIVVFQHTDYFLVITQKKIDEFQSSNGQVETSTHLVNGDDSCII